MPKKKVGPAKTLTISELVKLAEASGFDPEVLDGEIRAAADDEADLIYENTKSESLYGQLEFLSFHGWELGRLKEVIEKGTTDPFAE